MPKLIRLKQRYTEPRSYWFSNPRGRSIACALTQYIHWRMYNKGIELYQLYNGNIVWEVFKKVIFEDKAVKDLLLPRIPYANSWWYTDTESIAEPTNWMEWFKRGRGPVRGWLYKVLHTAVKSETIPGKVEYILLDINRWPGTVDPFEPMLMRPECLVLPTISGSRQTLSKELINQILISQGYKCSNCHCSINWLDLIKSNSTVPFQVDHFVPVSSGESSDILSHWANYCLVCVDCNSKKGAKLPRDILMQANNPIMSHTARSEALRKMGKKWSTNNDSP